LIAGDPDLRTRTALYFAVVATFALALTSIWGGRGVLDEGIVSDDATHDVPGQEQTEAEAAPAQVITGRVFLERELDEAGDDKGTETGATGGGTETGSSEPANRPENDETEGSITVERATACAVSVWRSGHMLIAGNCDERGSFALELPSGSLVPAADEVTSVEILVPRYLRASLPLTGDAAVARTVTGDTGDTLDIGSVGLGPAVPLRGLVLDAAGSGVANVVVEAMPVENLGEPEPWRATTNADGQFEYRTLPRGPLRLALSDSRYAPSVVEAVAPDHEVVLPVSRYETMSGSVRYESASDMGGLPALVRIEGSGVWPPRTAKVEDDGTFRFEQVPDGVYAVEALAFSADGSASFASDIIEDVSPEDKLSLTLKPSGWLRVLVTGRGGRPVGGARVTVGFGALSLLQKVGVTDAEGLATVGPLGMGSQVVSVAADGFLTAPGVLVEVAPNSDSAPVSVSLTRPQKLRGRVLDPRGIPSSSAVVEIVAASAFTPGENDVAAQVFSKLVRTATGSLGVTTGPVPDIPFVAGIGDVAGGRTQVNDLGEFVFNGLTPGEYTLVAYDAGYARSAPAVVRLPRSGGEPVVLTLREGVLVEGRIVDGRGIPLERATVQVLEDGVEVQSDARGRFDVGTRTGTIKVIIRAPGFAPRELSRLLGETAVFLDVALEPALGRFLGRARGGNDRVVEGALVRLSYANPLFADHVMVSDSRGLFDVEGLVVGTAKLEITHPDYVSQSRSLEVSDDADLTEIALISGWELSLEVRDGKRGDRVANAQITADARGVRSDRSGRALLSHLPPGAVLLEVVADDYVPWRQTLGGEDEARIAQVIELEEAGSIEGEVRDDVGAAVANVRVEVLRRGETEVLGSAKTDARGQFRVESLPAGEVELVARVPAPARDLWGDARLASDVLPGQVTRDVFLRFDMRPPQN